MDEELEETKEEFLQIFYDNIERDGAEELLDFLERSDFFTAPASYRFHSSFEGGLCLHSVNVYHRYVKLLEGEYGEEWDKIIPKESVAIIALLHDICKVNTYKPDLKNVKKDGVWVQEPYYRVEDSLPYGHGEKSVYMISGFMKLTREEAMAINWHMGGFDPRIKEGSVRTTDIFYRYPTAFLFHIADGMATYLDEKPTKN